jgi:tetratricopeptide (TPR) repeat protein
LAVQDYSEAIKLDPKNGENYNNRANAYSLLGKFDEAVKDYDEAIKLNDKDARIYANRGVIKQRLKKEDEAQKDFQKAVELDPTLKDKLSSFIAPAKAR